MTRIACAVATLTLVLGLAGMPAAAQAPQASSPIMGELVAVDTDAKTITVRPDQGEAVQIQYSDDTKVTGAQQNVAGLATAKNARVTVTFQEKGAAKIATQIEVQAEKK